jgi:glycosyltransferase involved in cell wall biosynthesis
MGDFKGYMIKILIFTTQIHLLGGSEKLAVELAEGLSSQSEIQVDMLVFGSEDVPGTADAKDRLLSNGVQSVVFLNRTPNTRGRYIFKFFIKLKRILKSNNYDIIETSKLGPTILACWATLGLRTQHIAGIHEIFQRDHQKRLAYKLLRLSLLVNRRTQFYAVSNGAMHHWINYSRINQDKIRVIYNSIASDHFKCRKTRPQVENIPNIDVNACKVLFVGRLCKRKGLDILIDALGPILDTENINLLIVGWQSVAPDPFYPGDENLLEKILLQIHNCKWEDRIHFLGIRDDVSSIMDFVDVLVHPARDEGFGLVLAEALAAGLPIVATSVGGIPEVLANTDSVLVPPDDPVALRNSFLDVIHRTPDQANRCRIRAKQRAEAFRPEHRIADFLAMFQDMLHS